MDTRVIAWAITSGGFEIWDSGGTLVAQSRQLALLAASERPPSTNQPP
jgi:hypothetical protein